MSTTAKIHNPLDDFKDQLRLSRTGCFYKLKRRLTAVEHEQLLDKVILPIVDDRAVELSGLGVSDRREVRSATLGSWNTTGETIEAYGTLLVQPVLQPASIGTSESPLQELKFAHVLILEGAVKRGKKFGQRYAFVNRDFLKDPLSDANFVERLSRAEMLNPFLSSSLANQQAGRIEELSMRMMNLSRVGLRRKVVEAYDVESSVSSLGLHRSIPGTMRVRLPRSSGVGTSVTISTGRHSVRAGSSRVKLSTVTDWFAQCVVRLDAENGKGVLRNDFLKEMAEQLDTLDNLIPNSLLLDFSVLDEAGFGTGAITWQRTEVTPAEWTDESSVLDAFDEPIPLKGPIPTKSSGVRVFEGALNFIGGSEVKIRLEVEGGSCRLTAPQTGLMGDVDDGDKRIPFEQLINRTNALRIAFDGGKVLYAAEGPHRSGNLRLAVQRLISAMVGVKALDKVESEKGNVDSSSIEFPLASCFYAIENDQAIAPSDTLVCGDAKDEVFDYLDIDEGNLRLRWLHAKVQKRISNGEQIKMGESNGSLSASSLQEVVGQAIKNLAFLRRDPSDPTYIAETKRWSNECTLPVKSKIQRLRRGSKPDVKVSKIVQNASAQHEVAIVVPTYSKKQLKKQLMLINSGKANQHTIQLFWLLSGFTHACLEVGVNPLIIMRD